MPREPEQLIGAKLRVLLAVYRNPSATNREIQKSVGLTETQVRRHLKWLRDEGFITTRRQGPKSENRVVKSQPVAADSPTPVVDLLRLLAIKG